jgi:hypothetical protein
VNSIYLLIKFKSNIIIKFNYNKKNYLKWYVCFLNVNCKNQIVFTATFVFNGTKNKKNNNKNINL